MTKEQEDQLLDDPKPAQSYNPNCAACRGSGVIWHGDPPATFEAECHFCGGTGKRKPIDEPWAVCCMDIRNRWWVMTTCGWEQLDRDRDGEAEPHDKIDAGNRIKKILSDVPWVFGVKMMTLAELATETDALEQMTMLANGIHKDEMRAAQLLTMVMKWGLNGAPCYDAALATNTGEEIREFLAGRAAGAGVGRCAPTA